MKKYFGLIVLFLIIGFPLANAAGELDRFDAPAQTAPQKDQKNKPEDKAKVEKFIEKVRTEGVKLLKKYAASHLTPEFETQFYEMVKDVIWSFYREHPKITIKFIDHYFARKEKSKKKIATEQFSFD